MANDTLYIYLFGHLRLIRTGQPIKFTALPKTSQLLAYLLLHQETAVPRDHLAFLLWDDIPETESRANLRRHLHDLRRALPDDCDWVLSDTKTVQWNRNAPFWLDLDAFRQQCQDAEKQPEAVTLYTGDLLPDLYADWLISHRERLQETFFNTLSRLIGHEREQGNLAQAVSYARQLLAYDPLREDVVRDLMLMRQENGDRAGALQLYQQFRTRLDEELGVPPMPETTAVYETIRANTVPILPAHQPITLPAHNLPALPASFVGRHEELAYIRRLLGSTGSATRLLTITGPGGSGKTRLAIEAGGQLVRQGAALFADGVFFVRLAELTRPEQLVTAVAKTINLRLVNNQNPTDALLAYLGDKKMLLILDNFEHMLTAAAYLSDWLAATPGLRLLVTSQALLYLYGEHELPLSPLPLPAPKPAPTVTELLASPAVALFVDRVTAVRHDFVLNETNSAIVAEICASLDGLPLALELAAARSKSFALPAIGEQLQQRLNFLATQTRDVAARQQTMRATIDWSYNLLDPPEQAVFCALAVFAGSFSLEMAKAVAGTAVAPNDSFTDILTGLVGRSMVRQMPEDEPTFRLFPILQEYGLEKLSGSGRETAVRWQHAHTYRQWAETAEQGLRTADQAYWQQQLNLAESNLIAALGWLFSEPTNEEMGSEGALLAGALERFFILRGRIAEGFVWLEKGLAYRKLLPTTRQTRLLNKAGSLAQWLGEYTRAGQWHVEALALARQTDDTQMVAFTLHFLGNINGRQGDYEAAYSQLSESLGYHRDLPDISPIQLTPLLNNLAIVCGRLGKLDQAMALLQESVALRRTMNDRLGLASNLGNLGNLAVQKGDYHQAAAFFAESLSIRQELQDTPGLLFSLGHVAELAVVQNWLETAVRLFAAVTAQRSLTKLPATADVQSDQERHLAQLRAALDENQFNQSWADGETLTLDEAVAEATKVVVELI